MKERRRSEDKSRDVAERRAERGDVKADEGGVVVESRSSGRGQAREDEEPLAESAREREPSANDHLPNQQKGTYASFLLLQVCLFLMLIILRLSLLCDPSQPSC